MEILGEGRTYKDHNIFIFTVGGIHRARQEDLLIVQDETLRRFWLA